MKRLLNLLPIILFAPLAAWAQTGTIRGQVIDKETNEAAIGATVRVDGLPVGANTDLEGRYNVTVPAGKYTVRIRMISYTEFTVTEVEVRPGATTVVNGYLVPEGTAVEEVVITAKQLKNSEASLLNIQRLAPQTVDGLGSRQMARIGDTDAGIAARRVVGLTVEGGRYVYVRGLGDRYSRTLVNGAEIPGLDPNRNAVAIDLFPTNLIDNLLVYKTSTPDLPGNFTGGLVNVTTRDFPDQYSLNISLSTSYNTQSTFNSDFLTYEGSSLDFLASGANDRALPVSVSNFPTLAETDRLNQVYRQFDQTWAPERQSIGPDINFNASLGNQKTLFGKPFGYLFSATYRRQYNYYDGNFGVQQYLTATLPSLGELTDLRDQRGTDEIVWGLLANFGLQLNANNRVSLNLMWNQGSEKSARYLFGRVNEQATTENYQEIRSLDYQQRANRIVQLRGNHLLPGLGNLNIEWISSAILTTLDQPDFRVYGVFYSLDPTADRRLSFGQASGDPYRFWRELDETNWDNRLHITKPFKGLGGRESSLKFGGAFTYKNREFLERQFQLLGGNLFSTDSRRYYNFASDPNRYFRTSNAQRDANEGLYYVYLPNFVNNYEGTESITAGYAMVDTRLTEKLRLVAGARFERTDIEVIPGERRINPDGTDNVGEIQVNDLLPSVGLTYALTDEMNLRANYFASVARPVFREIAPFDQFDFFSGPRTIGNPNLQRTLIQNYDLRYEYYPSPSEIISLSGYYKQMEDPIERAISVQQTGAAITWQNVPEATVYGAELEVRKNLGFVSNSLRHFQIGLNASYVFSEVDVPQQELTRAIQQRGGSPGTSPEQVGLSRTRELFGQSPYIVNVTLGYVNEEFGASYSIGFNVFGERLVLVADPGTPNYYEQPRPALDINFLQRLGGEGSRWTLRLGAQNVLNPDVRWRNEFNGREYNFTNFREGARYTLGIAYNVVR